MSVQLPAHFVAALLLSLFACALAVAETPLYQEKWRPQFHFTATKDWINDPNGLVYYDGEYHLFFQRRVGKLLSDGHMSWGHAVSTDLLHWQELPDALSPDENGSIWSGSAVVDWKNTTGFGKDGKPPLVAMYTRAKEPFSQCLAYSTDRGRTWTKFAGNPVLPFIHGRNRDPKVIWYEPAQRWIMVLHSDRRHEFWLFDSPDLKSWTKLQDVTLDGDDECPDFFPLVLQPGGPNEMLDRFTKWVFTAANGRYVVGTFDGKTFKRETDVLPSEFAGSYYAAQTFSDTPDGRRIQIGWLRRDGVLPDNMPFNQQLSIPAELTLRNTVRGPRLCRNPIKELKSLATPNETQSATEFKLTGTPRTFNVASGLVDVEAEFLLDANAVTLTVNGMPITVIAEGTDAAILAFDRRVSLPMNGSLVRLRILADRTSVEIFAQDGEVTLSGYHLADVRDRTVSIRTSGEEIKVFKVAVTSLKSTLPSPPAQ